MLGGTGLKVSTLSFGFWALRRQGGRRPLHLCDAHCRNAGINFLAERTQLRVRIVCECRSHSVNAFSFDFSFDSNDFSFKSNEKSFVYHSASILWDTHLDFSVRVSYVVATTISHQQPLRNLVLFSMICTDIITTRPISCISNITSITRRCPPPSR